MNQSRAFLTSLIAAGFAVVLVFLYIEDKESQISQTYGNEVPVIVAARDIQEFSQFESSDLSIQQVPRKFVQPGAVEAVGDENSRSERLREIVETVAAVPFKKGEQITSTKILQKGTETGLASQVAISHRALSIPVSDVTGVAKLVKPGDRVDIVTLIRYKADGGQESEVRTLLQNINVLAIGEQIQNQIPSFLEVDPLTGATSARNLRRDRNFSTVTIEVTPLEAQILIHSISEGNELFLTLRNPVDRAVASALPTTTVDEVLGPNSKKAVRSRPLPVPVQVPRKVAPPAPPNPFLTGGGSSVK